MTRCVFDRYDAGDLEDAAARARAEARRLGVSDADIDAALARVALAATAGDGTWARRTFGPIDACSATKANRVAAHVYVGVLAATAGALIFALVRGGASDRAFTALDVLGYAGLAVLAFNLRHALNLAFKATWYTADADMRTILVLAVVDLALGYALAFARKGPRKPLVLAVLAALLATTTVRLYLAVRSRNTQSYPLAGLSAADRLVTHAHIRRLRRYLRRVRASPPPKLTAPPAVAAASAAVAAASAATQLAAATKAVL